jgi:hypothetical protein
MKASTFAFRRTNYKVSASFDPAVVGDPGCRVSIRAATSDWAFDQRATFSSVPPLMTAEAPCRFAAAVLGFCRAFTESSSLLFNDSSILPRWC